MRVTKYLYEDTNALADGFTRNLRSDHRRFNRQNDRPAGGSLSRGQTLWQQFHDGARVVQELPVTSKRRRYGSLSSLVKVSGGANVVAA